MLSRNNLFKSFAALMLLGSVMATPALAADTVHEIHLDEPGTRLLNLSIGNVNILKVINDTDSPVCFSVPAYHVMESIPAKNHKNIKLNTAQSMEPYAFYTVGGSSSSVQTLTQTNSWSSTTKSQSLDKIINYNADYEVINDPEPLYYDNTYYQEPAPAPVKPKRMIRGYW